MTKEEIAKIMQVAEKDRRIRCCFIFLKDLLGIYASKGYCYVNTAYFCEKYNIDKDGRTLRRWKNRITECGYLTFTKNQLIEVHNNQSGTSDRISDKSDRLEDTSDRISGINDLHKKKKQNIKQNKQKEPPLPQAASGQSKRVALFPSEVLDGCNHKPCSSCELRLDCPKQKEMPLTLEPTEPKGKISHAPKNEYAKRKAQGFLTFEPTEVDGLIFDIPVELTQKEYNILVAAKGEEEAMKKITALALWFGNNPKEFAKRNKNDYKRICDWFIRDKEKNKKIIRGNSFEDTEDL
ncbi:MAG: hypothetical protein FWE37_02560 [Spirochaetaceae bacterium]|nr:hypothetical protein [Spirochaetaceae bacterium]